ncbi:MAG: beta-N-acetylhexosaminidase [Akkermansia sp.]|nr:beta-N-acetylhexosaminidase [Akkermansia sp.]
MQYSSLLRLLPLALASLLFPLNAALIPQPLQFEQAENAPGFALRDGIRVDIATSHSEMGRAAIRALMAAGFSVLPEEMDGALEVHRIEHDNPEAYTLNVTGQQISIGVATPLALHAAAQTLAQAAEHGQIPAMQVADAPALQHRGIMLDPSRHPISVADTKRILDLMARYKLNRLHWHLCDDQGWRIEIKKYPLLTSIGSKRKETSCWIHQEKKDGKPVEFFYSQAEIREVVEYAHSLGIIIIPEIEIPGHASAAVAAYPQLGNQDCPDFAPEVITGWGVFTHVMGPNDFTFQFIEDVLAEVCELFPRAPYIHIGGDEVPRDQWKTSPAAQAFMKEHGYTRESQIQDHFTHFCAQVLRKHGRRMVGWDEIMCAPQLPQDAVVMAWRGMDHARIAARRGHQLILCPIHAFYFNFPYGKNPSEPFYSGLTGFDDIDCAHVLNFDTSVPGNQVIGMQANLWSECIPNMKKLEFMLMPRLCALAEHAWRYGTPNRPGAADFSRRLQTHFSWFDAMRINYRQEDGTPRQP